MSYDIEIVDLGVRYSRKEADVAIRGLNLTLEADVIHGLLGRNGSGKTSLLSAIAGFRPVSSGHVRVGGQDPFENPRRTSEICLIREQGLGADNESVGTVLDLHRQWRPRWDQPYADRLLELFSLSRKKRSGGLSRGQRSALGIVVGLASRAPITMFDEAYLGLDAPSRYAFYDELLREYAEHPRTFVLSTHLIEEVGQLFEQVTVIDGGELVLQDTAEALGGRGMTVTGPTGAVDELLDGRTPMSRQVLGGTTAVTVDVRPTDDEIATARRLGLELGPVGLQDLVVHLTAGRTGEGNR